MLAELHTLARTTAVGRLGDADSLSAKSQRRVISDRHEVLKLSQRDLLLHSPPSGSGTRVQIELIDVATTDMSSQLGGRGHDRMSYPRAMMEV